MFLVSVWSSNSISREPVSGAMGITSVLAKRLPGSCGLFTEVGRLTRFAGEKVALVDSISH